MLELQYHLTEGDVVAGATHVFRSPEGRRQRNRLLLWVVPLTAASEAFRRWLDAGSWGEIVVRALLAAAFMALLAVVVQVVVLRLGARRAYRNGTLPVHRSGRLLLDDSGLVDELPGGARIYSYAELSSITETPTHVFIGAGPATYFVIPRRCGEEAVRAIASEVRRRLSFQASS